MKQYWVSWVVFISIVSGFCGFMWWAVNDNAAYAARLLDERQVTITKVDNGYVVELRQLRNPYPYKTKIAKDAGGAAAEVYAYLSGPVIRGESK